MKNISVIVLTYNEELHVARCIKSLQPICDDIFIIDSFSTDSTVEIATSLGCKVYQNEWKNYANQFQWALDHCPIRTEWVMRMDSDEILTGELCDEILNNLDLIPDNFSSLYVKRKVIFFDKWIRYGGYYPTWLLRIWRFKYGKIEERWMDEHIKMTHGDSYFLKHDIIDHNLNNITWWTNKHNNYATREVVDLLNTKFDLKKYDEIVPSFFGGQEQRRRKAKHIYSNLPLFIRPFIYFIYRYFFRFGFLDGIEGFIWHFLQGFWYRFLVDVKIYEILKVTGKNRDKIKDYLVNVLHVEF